MKNWIKIAALALMAAPLGCAKVEVVEAPDRAVTFTVGTYVPQTRGTSALDSLGVTSFSSRAFLHADGFPDEAQRFFGTEADPVETISYSRSGSVASWLPSHEYYWPKSSASYVNFFSWCGANPVLSYAKTDEGKYAPTMTWSGFEVTSDLLYADAAWHFNANAKTYLKEYDGAKVDEGVPTLFHHALSQVSFVGKQQEVEVTDNATNVSWAVKVTGLSLSGVVNKGTLTLSTTEPDGTEPKTSEWTAVLTPETTATTTLPATATTLDKDLSTSSETELIGYTTVLPQTLTESMVLTVNFTVTTTYTFTGGPKTVAEDVEKTVALTSGTGAVDKWDAGKQYKYTIIINPDAKAIKLIPKETDWTDMGEYPLTVE